MPTVKLLAYKFQAAIFDMDGTMVNNTLHHPRAWREFLRQHDITFTDEEYRQKIAGKKNDQIMRILFGDSLTAEEVKNYGDEKEAIYRELYAPDIKEVEGLTELINMLKARGLKLAIATTANEANRKFVLAALDLEDGFDAVLGEEHTTKGKPDPEIYLSTAGLLEVDPAKCLVFEDSPVGVKAAKAAGMTVVAVMTFHTQDELAEADYLVKNFSEIEIT